MVLTEVKRDAAAALARADGAGGSAAPAIRAVAPSLDDRAQAWLALHRPETGPAELARIATAHPEFARAIGRHPRAYPALVAWAADVAALRERARRASGVPDFSGLTDALAGCLTPSAHVVRSAGTLESAAPLVQRSPAAQQSPGEPIVQQAPAVVPSTPVAVSPSSALTPTPVAVSPTSALTPTTPSMPAAGAPMSAPTPSMPAADSGRGAPTPASTPVSSPSPTPEVAPPAQPALMDATSVTAVLAFVFAFVFAPLGVVFGHLALARQDRGDAGRSYAVAGLVIGYAVCALVVVAVATGILVAAITA